MYILQLTKRLGMVSTPGWRIGKSFAIISLVRRLIKFLFTSAHVAYASNTTAPDGGEACPESHPKRIMGGRLILFIGQLPSGS